MFDCVLPTRLARHGAASTRDGRINMRNKQHEHAETPIDAECGCYTCATFTRSYIRHLLHVEEMLGLYLMSLHNLHFLLDLMRDARAALHADRYEPWALSWLRRYERNAEAGI
jgi:queuine tRNA-ribosyltransferase